MSLLVVSPYENSQLAMVTSKAKKRVKCRQKKGWFPKKRKKSSKKPVADDQMANVDSYPAVDLVDEFTDSVKFNETSVNHQILSDLMSDPIFQCNEEPPLPLGDLVVVSPNEPPSDPLEAPDVDPLSTNSDNPQSDPVRSFILERKNEENSVIPLNSAGDKQVAALLQKAMADFCSHKIELWEFKKKNEWITNWRKLRYQNSESDHRALKESAPRALDLDSEVSEVCAVASLPCGTFKKTSNGPTLPRAKVSYSHSDRTPFHVADAGGSTIPDGTSLPATISSVIETPKKISADVPSSVPENSVIQVPGRLGYTSISNDEVKTTKPTVVEGIGGKSTHVPYIDSASSRDNQPSENLSSESHNTKKTAPHEMKTKKLTKTSKCIRKRRRTNSINSAPKDGNNVNTSPGKSESSQQVAIKVVEFSDNASTPQSLPVIEDGQTQSNSVQRRSSSAKVCCRRKTSKAISLTPLADESENLDANHDFVESCSNPSNPEGESASCQTSLSCLPISSVMQDHLDKSPNQDNPVQHHSDQDHLISACSLKDQSSPSLALSSSSHSAVQTKPAGCSCCAVRKSCCPGENLNRTFRHSGRSQSTKESCLRSFREWTSSSDTRTNYKPDPIRACSIGVQINTGVNAQPGTQSQRNENSFGHFPDYLQDLTCQCSKLGRQRPHNCLNCRANTACTDFGQLSEKMDDLPSTSIYNRATHPLAPRVHATCQNHSYQFSQYSPYLHNDNSASDSLPNFNAGRPSACLMIESEHSPHSHSGLAHTTDYASRYCIETCLDVSCRRNMCNHTTQMVCDSAPHHSAGRSCECSQSFMSRNTAKFFSRDSGTAGKFDWPLKCLMPKRECEDESSSDRHIVDQPPRFHIAPSSCHVLRPSNNHIPQCCSLLHSDSALSTSSHLRVDDQKMMSQVNLHEHSHSSNSHTFHTQSVKVNAAKIKVCNNGSSSELYSGYSAPRSFYCLTSDTDQRGRHHVGSYPRNPSSSAGLSIYNRSTPLDLSAVAVPLEDVHCRGTVDGLRVQRGAKEAQQNGTRNIKYHFPSPHEVPCQSHLEKSLQHSSFGQHAVATNSNRLPGPSSSSTNQPGHVQQICQRPNVCVGSIVISSEDDDNEESNFNALSVGQILPVNTGLACRSGWPINADLHLQTSSTPLVISSDEDEDRPEKNSSAICKDSLHSEKTARRSLYKNDEPVVISSDDDLTLQF